MPRLGSHVQAHVSGTQPNWNNRDCHNRGATPRPYSSGTFLTGGDYYGHRAITPHLPATVTRPSSYVHSRTPLTGGDRGRGSYQQTEHVDYYNHRVIPLQCPSATVTRPPSNVRSGTPLPGGDLGRDFYQQKENVDYFNRRTIPPQSQFDTQNIQQTPADFASKENEAGNTQETVADLSKSPSNKDH